MNFLLKTIFTMKQSSEKKFAERKASDNVVDFDVLRDYFEKGSVQGVSELLSLSNA